MPTRVLLVLFERLKLYRWAIALYAYPSLVAPGECHIFIFIFSKVFLSHQYGHLVIAINLPILDGGLNSAVVASVPVWVQ